MNSTTYYASGMCVGVNSHVGVFEKCEYPLDEKGVPYCAKCLKARFMQARKILPMDLETQINSGGKT